MKYIALFLLVLISIICISCTVPGNVGVPPFDDGTQEDAQEDFSEQYYSEFGDRPYLDIFAEPLPEDTPLVTLQQGYPALNISSYRDYCFVTYCPKGTPDYTPFLDESLFPDWVSTEGVTITVPERISVDFESFDIVLEKTDAPQALLFVKAPRIEKWVDGAWERIYYLHSEAPAYFSDHFAKNDLLVHNDKAYSISGTGRATVTVSRSEWITPIMPGKYRVLMYVGYQAEPMYAEFTIEE